MKRNFILTIILVVVFCISGGIFQAHATDNYGIPEKKSTSMDKLLLEFIAENVPEDAVWEDVPMNGNMALGWSNSVFDDMQGFCFSYTEGDVEKQIAIFDYITDDRVYRADNLWIDINNVPVVSAFAKMYAYEADGWKYIEDVDPYIQKKSYAKNGTRLLVSGEQWENNYEQSRLLIAVSIEKNLPDETGYFYQTTVQKRHHNVIWIGDYSIEFYWRTVFKAILVLGYMGIITAIVIINVRKKKSVERLMEKSE